MGKIMKDGIQYGVGGIQKAESITYDNTASGMTAIDVQDALDELSTDLTTTNGSLSSLIAANDEWESFNGSVSGNTQIFYRKRLNLNLPFYIICGRGTVSRSIGAGATSQVSISWSAKSFKTAMGGACNLAFQGQTTGYMAHCTLKNGGFDAYLTNNTTATLSTVNYTFIAIGVYW